MRVLTKFIGLEPPGCWRRVWVEPGHADLAAVIEDDVDGCDAAPWTVNGETPLCQAGGGAGAAQ
jgi:hypothetical protein